MSSPQRQMSLRSRPGVALLAALLLTLAFSALASAVLVTPTVEAPNPTCLPGTTELKVDPVPSGINTYTNGVLTVTIDVYNTSQGEAFNFSNASIPLHTVIAKGGNQGGNRYTYSPTHPTVTSDNGLHTPTHQELSHISFCYVVPMAIELGAFEAQWVDEQVAVAWETVSETNHLGFNLYRSTSETELGEQLNAEMISAQASGSSQGALYAYRDSNVVAGLTYWYTLQDVDTNGHTSLHGPVAAVPDAPTAVTIGTMTSQGGNGGQWFAVMALLAAAGAVVARRRR